MTTDPIKLAAEDRLIGIANALEYGLWTKKKAASEIDTVIKSLQSQPASTRANERIDWAALNKILRHARSKNESCALELTNWIADNQDTPQPSPQSDMVAVPREVMDRILECVENGYHEHSYLSEAEELLQPYTKGD